MNPVLQSEIDPIQVQAVSVLLRGHQQFREFFSQEDVPIQKNGTTYYFSRWAVDLSAYIISCGKNPRELSSVELVAFAKEYVNRMNPSNKITADTSQVSPNNLMVPVKRKRGRPPKNRALVWESPSSKTAPQPEPVKESAEDSQPAAVISVSEEGSKKEGVERLSVRGSVPYVVHVAALSNIQAVVTLYSACSEKDASARIFMDKANALIDEIYEHMMKTGCLK